MKVLESATKTVKFLTILVALIAIIAPVYFAIHQSWQQVQEQEQERVLNYARDVLARIENTSDQMANGFKLLADAKLLDPCSKPSINIMKKY